MFKYIFVFVVLLVNSTVLCAQKPKTKSTTNPTTQQGRSVTAAEAAAVPRPSGSPGWSGEERVLFLNHCVAQVSFRRDSSLAYCACMLQKLEAQYAVPAEASTLSADTINAWAKQCMGSGKAAVWNKAYRREFLANCEKAFLRGAGRTKAQATSYCSCMLKKAEAAYPNPLDTTTIDQETMKAWAKDCLKQ